jgi:hypothetical protein
MPRPISMLAVTMLAGNVGEPEDYAATNRRLTSADARFAPLLPIQIRIIRGVESGLFLEQRF